MKDSAIVLYLGKTNTYPCYAELLRFLETSENLRIPPDFGEFDISV
jgi:hypothetical protein